MKKKLLISLVIGIVASIIALYYSFRNIPFDELWQYIGSVNYIWVIPSTAMVIICLVLRAIRWQILLSPYKDIGFWKTFHPTMIAFMLNCILPGRVGEIARPLIIQKEEKIPFSTGLATVTAERLFDSILIIIIFAIFLLKVQIDPKIDITFGSIHLNKSTLLAISSGIIKFCLFAVTLVILIINNKTRKIIITAINKIPSLLFFINQPFRKRLQENLFVSIAKALDNFSFGFLLVKNPKKIYICTILSIIIWMSAVFASYIMAIGSPGINLSFFQMSGVTVIICFFVALPSVPGYWGLWEAGGVFGMSLFGVSSKEAAGFTLINHFIQIVPVIIVGIFSAFITSANIWRLYEKE